MTPEEIAAMQAENAKMKADLEKLKNPPKDPPAPPPKDPPADPSLADTARKEREEAEKKSKYEKDLGAAMKFNLGAAEFLKVNAGLLPKTAEGIFAAAEKTNFDSEVEKANEIKAGLVSEFFAIQSNLDQLTGEQKVELEDFLKLTKNKQQERIANVYAMIFQPTLESIRKQLKAKQVSDGSKDQSDSEKMLAEKMMKQSKKHYLGDKE